MEAFFYPCFYCPKYVEKREESDGNQVAITLPANVAEDQIKTTINKKTGILTVSAENDSEKEFSRNGWTGTTRSFSRFSKSIRLPKHVMENEEMMKQVTADRKANQLKITFPEPKRESEEEHEKSKDLIDIETVKE